MPVIMCCLDALADLACRLVTGLTGFTLGAMEDTDQDNRASMQARLDTARTAVCKLGRNLQWDPYYDLNHKIRTWIMHLKTILI